MMITRMLPNCTEVYFHSRPRREQLMIVITYLIILTRRCMPRQLQLQQRLVSQTMMLMIMAVMEVKLSGSAAQHQLLQTNTDICHCETKMTDLVSK